MNFREYPERSVQEMLINGLVHRDYLETGSEVHVDIFDDRMEITSPGGMPGDRKVQEYPNIRRIPSRRRNKCLADMFERLDLMERKGSGFKKLNEDYENLSPRVTTFALHCRIFSMDSQTNSSSQPSTTRHTECRRESRHHSRPTMMPTMIPTMIPTMMCCRLSQMKPSF